MASEAVWPDSVTAMPGRTFKVPVPLADSDPLAVLGLMARRADAPVAVILELMSTLFEADKVSAEFDVQETAALMLTLPLPDLPPLLLCKVTEVVPRLDESAAPVMSPPLAATVKSCGSMSQLPKRPWDDAVVI